MSVLARWGTTPALESDQQGVSSVTDFLDPASFGAAMDGVTDDTTAMQLALNQGGAIRIRPGLTIRCASNLAMISNTHLIIDGQLWLDTSRISAIGAGITNVRITGRGSIKSTNLNTTDGFPTNWARRGIVEFGGTFASIGSNFVLDGIEVFGDFAGTPTAGGSITDRVCVLTTNAKNVIIRNCDLHNAWAEVLVHNGASANGDSNIVYARNTIHDSNHDAIGPMFTDIQSFVVAENVMFNCFAGVEAMSGKIENNVAYNMQQSGYWFGGNQVPAGIEVAYNDNLGINNCLAGTAGLKDFQMECPGAAAGTLVFTGNVSHKSNGGAFSITFVAEVACHGNEARGWGVLVAGKGLLINNCTSVAADGNSLFTEGASSNGGFQIAATRVLLGPSNRADSGVAIPWVNTSSAGQGIIPAQEPVMFTSQQVLTGTLAATALFTRTLLAKMLGKTGGVIITIAGVCSGAGGGKTIKIKFGGTTLLQINAAAGDTFFATLTFTNNGTTGGQLVGGMFVSGATATPVTTTAAIDTTVDQNLVVEGTLANVGDALTLNSVAAKSIFGWVP